jgi:hypothetical protein
MSRRRSIDAPLSSNPALSSSRSTLALTQSTMGRGGGTGRRIGLKRDGASFFTFTKTPTIRRFRHGLPSGSNTGNTGNAEKYDAPGTIAGTGTIVARASRGRRFRRCIGAESVRARALSARGGALRTGSLAGARSTRRVAATSTPGLHAGASRMNGDCGRPAITSSSGASIRTWRGAGRRSNDDLLGARFSRGAILGLHEGNRGCLSGAAERLPCNDKGCARRAADA